MTPELIVGITALITAVFTGLKQFKHSACCWGGFELDSRDSYIVESNEVSGACDTSGSTMQTTNQPSSPEQLHSHDTAKAEKD